MSVTPFLLNFTAWVQSQPDVLAAALVGSHARGTASPTSDVDLVILARDPQKYLSDQSWINRFGEPLRTQMEDYGRLTSLRVWYQSGLEVEFGLTGADWAARPLDAGTRRVIGDGMRVLFERQPLLSPFQPIE